MVKTNTETVGAVNAKTADILAKLVMVKNSRETAFEAHRLLLLGRQGEGKTLTALTMSERFTGFPAEDWTTLDDIFVLLFDSEGLLSAYGMKYDVPHIDFSPVPGHLMDRAIHAAFTSHILPGVNSGQIKTLVIDSISSLDSIYKTTLCSSGLEGQDIWTQLLSKHMAFSARLRELGCHVIVVAHGTAVAAVRTTRNEEVMAEHEARLTADGLAVGEVKMDITGQGAKFYRRNWSNIWPVKAKGPREKRIYNVYPYGTEGFEHKCRLTGLEKEEPCNLREILARVRGTKNG